MTAHRVPATTGDLIQFVLKRLAEDHMAADQAMAYLVAGAGRDAGTRMFQTPCWYSAVTGSGDQVVAIDPRRALDDVGARRRLVLAARRQIEHGTNIGIVNAWREVVRTLAASYVSHPEYRPEWAPTSQN
jgi:hypothetical protein